MLLTTKNRLQTYLQQSQRGLNKEDESITRARGAIDRFIVHLKKKGRKYIEHCTVEGGCIVLYQPGSWMVELVIEAK